MKKLFFYSGVLIIFLSALTSRAQYIEDALRMSQHKGYITARAGGFGVSFQGISDDLGALAYNPAGLSLVAKSEFSLGFGFTRNSTGTNFYTDIMNFKSNNAYVTHLGFVVPFKTSAGNASVGIGYYLEDNYNDNIKYSGFNPYNTMIADAASQTEKTLNFPYQYFLTDRNFVTPIKDSLQQEAFIQEKGGLHNISGGAAFDLSDFVSIGFAIDGKWGTYNYIRDFKESDILNKYRVYDSVNFTDIDFNNLQMNEALKQDIGGITGSFGIQFRFEDFLRAGATVKFPTFYEITEDFSQTAKVFVDNGHQLFLTSSTGGDSVYYYSGTGSYKITTPFVYSAGLSVHGAGLTFSAGVEYSDVSQIEVSDAVQQVMSLNSQILQQLVAQTTWGFGIEYEFPLIPVIVRGSYSSTTSPYVDDIAGASLKNVAFGGGIYLAKNVRLDGLFRWSNLSQKRSNYGISQNTSSQYTYTTSPLDIGLQLTYRY